MHRMILLVVALMAATLPAQGDAVKLVRTLKDGTALRYKVTSAESFDAEGKPDLGIKVHGTAEFKVVFSGAGDAGPAAARVSYTFLDRGVVGGPSPRGHHLPLKDGTPDAGFAARITPAEVFVDGWEKGLAGQMPAMFQVAKPAPALLAWQRLSWAALPHRHLQAALPPLPAAPVKTGDSWPAWMYAGEVGDNRAVRLDFNCVVKEIGAKTVKFGQYGKPVLFEPGAAAGAAAPGTGATFTLDAAKSSWSAEVEISREDGILLSREGEVVLHLAMTDPASPGAPVPLRAKIWMKIERLSG